jgi:hypothetical protein
MVQGSVAQMRRSKPEGYAISGAVRIEWNEGLRMPLIPVAREAAMHRIKHPPIRNKIDLADPAQLRAWTRRLGLSADALKAVVDKVGNSVAAVSKEVELQRASPAVVQSTSSEGELPTSG